MLPGLRGQSARERTALRRVALLLAFLFLGAVGEGRAQTQPLPPGLRPTPAPPGDRAPNFIAIPLAPAAPAPTPAPSPGAPSAPSRVRAASPAPTPVPGPAPTAAETAPVGLPIQRAVIHYLGAVDAAGAQRAVDQLRRLADTIELRVVSDVPARPSIRYFYAEDAGAARVAAIALEGSGNFQIRGFPEYRPRPRPGLVEVWLPAP